MLAVMNIRSAASLRSAKTLSNPNKELQMVLPEPLEFICASSDRDRFELEVAARGLRDP